MREDSPEFYKRRMQQLLNQARKNGISTDYILSEGPKGRTMKLLFKNKEDGLSAAVTVKERKYK